MSHEQIQIVNRQFDNNIQHYNGYSLEAIKQMDYTGWIEEHKREYINNCKQVIEYYKAKICPQEILILKNRNFLLVSFYMKAN